MSETMLTSSPAALSVARDFLCTIGLKEKQIDEFKVYTGMNESSMAAYVGTQKRLGRPAEDIIENLKSMAPAVFDVLVLPDLNPKIGTPMKTIRNFLFIMRKDPYFSGCKYNTFKNCYEIHLIKNRVLDIRLRDDEWDSKAQEYIETNFGLYCEDKFKKAATILFHEREYDPIQELIKSYEWDGIHRREHFLTEWALADDTPYIREVSRLIFDGIVARTFDPKDSDAAKFDYVPVLQGKQGSGKSTLVRWLALQDEFYLDLTDIEGKDAIISMMGHCVCEVGELKAIKGARNPETVKAFITRPMDNLRIPYEQTAKDYPRRCIFIGSTNHDTFLTDKTGGRRFPPIMVHSDGASLYSHRAEIKEYIRQCYAEAYAMFMDEENRPVLNMPKDISDIAEQMETEVMMEDPRIGQIEHYIAHDIEVGKYVCSRWAWEIGLHLPPEKFGMKEAQEIGLILKNFSFLEKQKKQHRFGALGPQTTYKKITQPKGYD